MIRLRRLPDPQSLLHNDTAVPRPPRDCCIAAKEDRREKRPRRRKNASSAIFPLTIPEKCGNIYQLHNDALSKQQNVIGQRHIETSKSATVAQSVEQLIRNQQVAGSSPASSSIERPLIFLGKSRVSSFLFDPPKHLVFRFWRTFGARSCFLPKIFWKPARLLLHAVFRTVAYATKLKTTKSTTFSIT